MTTNHVSKLDRALIRPGRVDLQELIDDATAHQSGELYRKFYSDSFSTPEELEKKQSLVQNLVDEARREGMRISMAALQGHFIRCSAAEAIERWDLLLETVQATSKEASSREKFVIPSMP